MIDMRRFQSGSPVPSRQALEKTCLIIEENLDEMRALAAEASRAKNLKGSEDKRRLLLMAGLFFDFYLLAEDCFLQIARSVDLWIPGSLDWRRRLIGLMRVAIPDKRPPLLSPRTADLLDDFLILCLNFHRHSSALSAEKMEKMAGSVEELYELLENDLGGFKRLFRF